MALRLFWTGHGISATAATANAQMLSANYLFSFTRSVTSVNTGRFTGTRGIECGTSGQFGTVQSALFPFESDKVIRGAVDVRFSSAGTTHYLFSVTNGTVLGDSSTIGPMFTTSTYLGFQRNASNELQLLINNVVVATSTTTGFTTNTWHHIEWEIKVDASGTCDVWLNNSLEISYTGNTTNGLTATYYRFRTGNGNTAMSGIYMWDNAAGGAFDAYVGDFEPVQLLPDANGTTNDGTAVGAASNFQCVDETFRNGDTDYVSMSDSETELYSYATLAGSPTIHTVVVQPSFRSAYTRMRAEAECLSNGSALNSNPSRFVLNAGDQFSTYGPIPFIWDFDVDPDTGLAWDAAGVNAAEFGVTAYNT